MVQSNDLSDQSSGWGMCHAGAETSVEWSGEERRGEERSGEERRRGGEAMRDKRIRRARG